MSSHGQIGELDRLGAAFDEAIAHGHLGEKPETPDDQVITARRRVIGGYLFLLGYLAKRPPDKADDEGNDSDVERAIAAFQRDAGLVEDGWAGRETWDAIQQLASFEHPTDVARWFDGATPRPALQRATYLRLFAFGLTLLPPRPETRLQSKEKESREDFRKGLEGFSEAARLLGLGTIEAAVTPETLALLFDQDAICERVRDYLFDPGAMPQSKDDRDRVDSFLQNVAQVELWLYGYNVKIGNFKPGGPFDQGSLFPLKFGAAMLEFCTDHGIGEGSADIDEEAATVWYKSDAMAVLPEFFEHLAELNRASPDPENVEDADRVVDKVLQEKQVRTGVLGSIETLGARLWDGIKRVGNWIKSVFVQVFQSVKKIAKRIYTNISRYIHETALRVFSHVVAAVRAVENGVEFLAEEVLLGSHPQQMIVMHDGDLDFNVFVNARAAPAAVENFSARIVLRSEILGIGCKIVGSVLSFFLSVIRFGISTGWFALMLALVKLYRTITSLRDFSRRAASLLAELADLRSRAFA